MSMNLNVFMAKYNVRKSEEEKEELVKEYMVNDYIPFETKADYATEIIKNSCYAKKKDVNGNEYEELHVDSVARYMLTLMTMFDLFTSIERDKGNGSMLKDFNDLNKSGILDYVVKNIDERELKEFRMIIQMVYDDLIVNEYETHAFISKQVERFGSLVGTSIAPVLSQLDTTKIEEIVNNMINSGES